jgi:hypothetical protein
MILLKMSGNRDPAVAGQPTDNQLDSIGRVPIEVIL